jgi:hypothetical protein
MAQCTKFKEFIVCTECKNFHKHKNYDNSFCKRPNGYFIHRERSYRDYSYKGITSASYPNKNNDCKCFQKKPWYKFW